MKETIFNTINDISINLWPMMLIFSIILILVRVAYLRGHHQKFILYKEIISLVFVLYILSLFYVVTYHEGLGPSSSNYIPFKEIMRFKFGSDGFFRNVIGNIILFVPFGFFITYYIDTNKFSPILLISLVTSASIEFTQKMIGRVFDIDDIMLNVLGAIIGYLLFVLMDSIENHLPKTINNATFKNLLFIVVIALVIIYCFGWYSALFSILS